MRGKKKWGGENLCLAIGCAIVGFSGREKSRALLAFCQISSGLLPGVPKRCILMRLSELLG